MTPYEIAEIILLAAGILTLLAGFLHVKQTVEMRKKYGYTPKEWARGINSVIVTLAAIAGLGLAVMYYPQNLAQVASMVIGAYMNIQLFLLRDQVYQKVKKLRKK